MVKDIQELARAHSPEAIRALVAALADPRSRVAAAVALLDRGYGRPTQEHNVNHNLPAASATDAALIAIATGGGSVAAASADDTDQSGGVVH